MYNQDLLLYNKAKKRVITRLFVSWFLLLFYFVGVFFVLNLDFLKTANNLNTVIIVLAISQLCLYGFIFLLLSFGKKIFRILYWLVFILTLFLIYVPIQFILQDLPHILTYSSLLGFMLIKIMFLSQLGSYLKHNKWSRIFFDLTIDIYEDEEDDIIQQPVLKTKVKKEKRYQEPIQPTYVIEEEEEEYEDEPYTQPQISIRLGIGIYASLMVFPILIQIFSNFFASYDLQTVFATKDMFMLCIFTALIWTVPVFYLYYDHPYAKRTVLICAILEVLCVILYSTKLVGYYVSKDPEYPLRVFILFIIVDMIRYVIIFYCLKPLLQIDPSTYINEETED